MDWRVLSKIAVLQTIVVSYAIGLLILASAYAYPTRIVDTSFLSDQGDSPIYVPILLSLLLLIPIYLWQKDYRHKARLSTKINAKDKSGMLFWIFTLFTLALSVRIPSVLLFAEPYEKTPLIFLLVMTIILVERTEPSAFGFKTQGMGKSLVHGLLFFAVLSGMTFLTYDLLVYALTSRTVFQSYDFLPFLFAMSFMTLCVGIGEEGLFRGYMQTHLEEFYGVKQAILVQAILFGGWHFVWNLSPFNAWAMVEYVAQTFVSGLLFGYFYSKTRNLVPLIFAHGLWNSMQMGIITNTTTIAALQNAPLMGQILTWILPLGVSAAATFFVIKYYPRRFQRSY
jgi:membrane protease YdiL (CAAX protease family)